MTYKATPRDLMTYRAACVYFGLDAEERAVVGRAANHMVAYRTRDQGGEAWDRETADDVVSAHTADEWWQRTLLRITCILANEWTEEGRTGRLPPRTRIASGKSRRENPALTPKQIEDVHAMSTAYSQVAIAKHFGVAQSTISRVLSGERAA